MSAPRITYLKRHEAPDLPLPGSQPPDLDPDHHLWKNGSTWWIAFTIHTLDWRKRRLRFSLRTRDIREARARRDRVLQRFDASPRCALSLRYARLGA